MPFAVSVAYGGSAFSERIQPMEYGGFNCQGTESSLQQCAVTGTYVTIWSQLFFCNEEDYAGVRCIPKTHGEICQYASGSSSVKTKTMNAFRISLALPSPSTLDDCIM